MGKKSLLFFVFLLVAAAMLALVSSVRISDSTHTFFAEEATNGAVLEATTVPGVIVPPELILEADYEWNKLAAATLLRGYEIDVTSGLVREKEGNSVAALIAVKGEGIFYAPGMQAGILFYDANGRFISGSRIMDEEEVFMEYPKDCGYVSISMADENLSHAIFVDRTDGIHIVSQKESASINKAVQEIQENGDILVFPGIYRENVGAYGKQIGIYGVDREKCVLESISSNYYTPPLEISGGVVANMTIRAVDDNSGPSALYAYGVHVEDHFLCDNTLLFKNCNIYSDFNSAVGMGLRGGCEVTFEDCVLKGRENGLFVHDCPYQKYTGTQRLIMRNCIVEGMEGDNAIRVDSQGVAGADVELTFQDNVFQNGNGTEENLLYARNNNGRGTKENFMELKNFRLSFESRGNNIDELNAKNEQSLQ